MNGYEVFDLEWANAARTEIFVSTSATLYKFNVMNNAITSIGSGLSRSYDIAVHPNDYNIVYSASSNGVYKSTNGGVSFVSSSSGP